MGKSVEEFVRTGRCDVCGKEKAIARDKTTHVGYCYACLIRMIETKLEKKGRDER